MLQNRAPLAFLVVPLMMLVVAIPAIANAPTLKRAMLSTSGVGYFDYEVIVDGDGTLELPVHLDQVYDVLKSIVVYNDTGGVGMVSMPGQHPLDQVFKDLPFGPNALSSPIALLDALQGSEVEAVGARSIRGRLLRVIPEMTRLPGNAGSLVRHRVSLMTRNGLQHLIFEQAESLRFADTGLQA